MRSVTTLLATATVAMAVTSIWALHSRQELKARVVELEQQLAAVPVKLAPETASPSSDVETNPESPAKTATAPSRTASPENRSQREIEAREHLRAMARRQSEMLRDPAYRQSQLEAGRRQFARTRAEAIRVVGMTPEQADRVISLWVERNLRFQELSQGVPGEPPSAAAQAELTRALDAEQAELRTLLGQEKYDQWGRYLASGEERAEVTQLAQQLAITNELLRDSQADALVDAIYSERQRRSREYEEYVKSMGITDRNVVSAQDRQRWLDLEKEANQRIHTAVAGTMSSAQLASLDEMLAARLAPVEAALRLQLGELN